MTTSVVVKARAWGATVVTRTATEGQEGHNIDEQTVELGAHEDRTFHIPSGGKMTFEVSEPSEAPVSEEAAEEAAPASEEAPATTEEAPASTTRRGRGGFGGSSSEESAEA